MARDFEIVPTIRKFMCALGYHWYHPSAMEMKYLRNEGKFWVYEVKSQCIFCQKSYSAIVSIAKPIKEERDD